MTTVAVMQPYFVPYAGYFRLFEVADVFVAFDCVQFPRRGYVHRNRLPDRNAMPSWLTLPVTKADRTTTITNMTIVDGAAARFADETRRFPCLADHDADPLLCRLLTPTTDLAAFLVTSLAAIVERLELSCTIIRSSTLDIPAALTGQDRVLAILDRVGGTHYVNAPGGRALYDATAFEQRGITLSFLAPFVDANAWSILHHLATSAPRDVTATIRRQARLES